MPARKGIAPELLEKARHLYENALAPADDIANMLGMTRPTFDKLTKTHGWCRRRAGGAYFHFARAAADTAAVQQALPPAGPVLPPGPERRADIRAVLAARVHGIVERGLEAVERVLAVLRPIDQAEAERCARTLAGLACTTREFAALNAPEDATPPDDDDERDGVPVDIDQLRDELARRLRGLAEQRKAERLPGPDP